MADDPLDRFVETWGTMGTLWGVNTSVARVHGLLIASSRPWCLDEISEKLGISKSNASMSLKELRGWGVVQKTIQPGDRREFWTTDPDVWNMLFSILRERKKREFDPARKAVAKALEATHGGGTTLAMDRLEQMEKMLETMDSLGERILADEDRAKDMLRFLVGAEGLMRK